MASVEQRKPYRFLVGKSEEGECSEDLGTE